MLDNSERQRRHRGGRCLSTTTVVRALVDTAPAGEPLGDELIVAFRFMHPFPPALRTKTVSSGLILLLVFAIPYLTLNLCGWLADALGRSRSAT